MGSLSNLFISQSYISLIHLGSDNVASSTPTELQDGLGNGIGVSVSTNKNLYVSGNVYATNLTGSTIDTGSLVTTSSFNAYTQSTNTFTASISTSVGNLETYAAYSNQVLITQSFQINANALTASNATTALSQSLYFTDTTQSVNIASNSSSIGLLQTFSGSQYKNDSSSFDSRIDSLEIASGAFVTTSSFNSYTSSQDLLNTTFATTGSNTFTGNQTIEGAIVSNITSSVIKLFSAGFVSGAVQYNITASNATSQSNLIFGGTPLGSTQTGSVIISGSGNILHNPAKTLAGARAFDRGYVGGNNNYFVTIPLLHTQSLFNPTVQANIGTGQLSMNFITSSIAVPFFVNNNFSSTITLNHQSGTMQMQNNMSNGLITSTQNGLTSGTVAATFNSNIIGGGGLSLNHTSSSILTTTNAIIGGTTVNNNYFHTGSNNSLTLAANLTNGQNIVINAGGSPSTNVSRPIVANLLGGSAITIQADAVGTDSAGLRNEIVYGYNLIVSGAQSVANTTNQGGAFFGRYNDITNLLADSGKTIFAVGTGTSTSNRKTALSVDSASVVNVSGSLSVTGSSTFNGNIVVTGSLAVTGSSTFNGNIVVTGSLVVTGSSLSIDSSGNITASGDISVGTAITASTLQLKGNNKVYFQTLTYGTSSFVPQIATDGFQLYQNQGQPYAFNINLQAGQYNDISGSQFLFGLQTNGSGQSTFGGSNYFALISGSLTQSVVGGSEIKGGDVLVNSGGGLELVYNYAFAGFAQKVYMDKGLYISSSGVPTALTLNTNGGTAMIATGSVKITGSLDVSSTITSPNYLSLGTNTVVTGSLSVVPNQQLKLGSGSNQQTGLATLDGANPGTVTVSNSLVTANSIIMLTKQTNNHPNAGPVVVSSKGSGTFTITANHNGDTDVVAFMIINPS